MGDATARTIAFEIRQKEDYYYPNSAWRLPFLGGYKFETQPGVLSLPGYVMYYFLATGVTPAMEEKMIGRGSQYAWACEDASHNPLDGAKNYKLRLPPNIPVKEFWSVIVYSNQTRSMLQTDQQYPSVGSQTKGLLVNEDGSVDVYFGPKAPPGKEKNWVETVPGKGWNTSCVCTARSSRGLTRPGGREISSPSCDFADAIPRWATDRSDVHAVLTVLFARAWFNERKAPIK